MRPVAFSKPTALPAIGLAAVVFLAAACGGAGDSSEPAQTSVPKTPEETAGRFLSLWQEGEYAEMYELLSSEAQATIERRKFIERYEAITGEARITGMEYVLKPPATGEVTEVEYTVTFHTSFFDDIVQDNVMPLVREEIPVPPATEGAAPGVRAEWRVQWTPSLFFKELDGRTLVHFFTHVPRRGGIYDRHGRELAIDARLPVVGIVPDLVTDKEALVARLAPELGLPADEVWARVNADLPSYYFIPVKTLQYGTPPEELIKFQEMVDLGVVVREETQRIYPHGPAAAHILGYMTEVTPEELEELAPKGFTPGDRIGAFGLEGQFDDVLAGERGGLLATITPEGSIARTIAEKPAVAGKDAHLTIDIELQKLAEETLGERVGSIIAMDPRDNSVLAMASYPRFDPNGFIQGLSAEKFDALANDPRQPFLHRPLLATYPAGSTFKAVTAAAGLERGGFTPESRFHCTPLWTRLGEEFAQRNWQTADRGHLTVAEGLMASCNPVFFDIAKELDERDPDILPEFARAFGFGRPTGINGLDEAPGVVPDDDWKLENVGDFWYTGDAVNMAIGQGFVLVTPMQIVNAYSALAHSGLLRKPLLVRAITEQGGAAAQEFEAEVINPLPVSPGTLEHIRHGLTLVTQSPGGTSYQVFAGAGIDAAGKSGTAEDLAAGSDHVFFVAYANRSNPSIVAIAALEDGQSGSREAGPMVRRIMEAHIARQAAAGAQ
jgi:penicillin-binding protein 2